MNPPHSVLERARLRFCRGFAALLLVAGAAGGQLSVPPNYEWRQMTPTGEAGSSTTYQWMVDPRGEWVVFVGDIENAGAYAVYSMRRNGSVLHRLSPYAPSGEIQNVRLTDDGRRVVYQGDLETDGLAELWSAPLDGTPASAVKLNLPVIGDGVSGVLPNDAAGRLAYLAETADGTGVWTVPVAGPAGAAVRVDPGDELGGIYGGFLAAEAGRVVLTMFEVATAVTRIWSVPVAGPAASGLFLFESPPDGCTPFVVAWSPGTTRIAYTLQCDTPVGSRVNQLWSVPIAGPAAAAVSLGGSFIEGGSIYTSSPAPDGSRLVFIADKLADERFELWSVPITGPAGELVRLNPALQSLGDVKSFDIAADSSFVAYIADQSSNEVFRAHAVPIGGPSSESIPLVTGALSVLRDVTSLAITPNGASVILRADFTVDERFDLYSVPSTGAFSVNRITNDGLPGPEISVSSLWRLHPDGARIAFAFDEETPNDQRGLGEQRLAPEYIQDARLNGDPVDGGRVVDFKVFPDSRGTIYRSDELVDERYHLFSVDSRIFGDGFEGGTTAAWADTP